MPQLLVVIDFAVEGDAVAARHVGHRLRPAGDVDYAEPRVAQRAAGLRERRVCVGAAMAERSDHPIERALDALDSTDNRADAAHVPGQPFFVATTIPGPWLATWTTP